jgi:uncharacterized protein (TIGR04255 family)
MKISPSPRVEYQHNPLAEVVCQVKFPVVNRELESFANSILGRLGAEYPNKGMQQLVNVAIQFGEDVGQPKTTQSAPTKICFATSSDKVWRASVSADFVSLACARYTTWTDFLPRLLALVQSTVAEGALGKCERVGLRYKDLIERDKLGLQGVAWSELISPFLLGPLGKSAFADHEAVDERDVAGFVSQCVMKLDEGSVVLQSALLHDEEAEQSAFLIDADFFTEGGALDFEVSDDRLGSVLENLHSNAGALFRRAITEKLHDALKPRTS